MSIRNALEELLLTVEIHQKDTKNNFAWAEVEYAKQLLAQPEQTEQEPMAWKDKNYGNLHHVDYGNSIPLYTSPLKRKPLSDHDTAVMFYDSKIATCSDSYWAGIEDAEKSHGIGE